GVSCPGGKTRCTAETLRSNTEGTETHGGPRRGQSPEHLHSGGEFAGVPRWSGVGLAKGTDAAQVPHSRQIHFPCHSSVALRASVSSVLLRSLSAPQRPQRRSKGMRRRVPNMRAKLPPSARIDA